MPENTSMVRNDLLRLFLNDTPMMDVRAPVEYAKGAFPNSSNLPLMTDKERQLVGICYKENGQAAAIELGKSYYTPETKQHRIQLWQQFAQTHPEGVLYCFRGGLRSRLTQQLLAESGQNYPLVEGGYKVMRRFLLDQLIMICQQSQFILIGGLTGTGKTDLINQLPNSVDLEGIAHHRGSSFGRHAQEQPTQINFENRLIIEMMKRFHGGYRTLILEDEGHFIGRCVFPEPLKKVMSHAPVVLLENKLDKRTQIAYRDYIKQLSEEFAELYPDQNEAFSHFSNHIKSALERIKNRLGGERYQHTQTTLDEALVALKGGNHKPMENLIRKLLLGYYDPMYQWQIEKKASRVIFNGEASAVQAFLAQRT